VGFFAYPKITRLSGILTVFLLWKFFQLGLQAALREALTTLSWPWHAR